MNDPEYDNGDENESEPERTTSPEAVSSIEEPGDSTMVDKETKAKCVLKDYWIVQGSRACPRSTACLASNSPLSSPRDQRSSLARSRLGILPKRFASLYSIFAKTPNKLVSSN